MTPNRRTSSLLVSINFAFTPGPTFTYVLFPMAVPHLQDATEERSGLGARPPCPGMSAPKKTGGNSRSEAGTLPVESLCSDTVSSWGSEDLAPPCTLSISRDKDMISSTLTSNDQTTLPKPVRDVLDLQPGDRIEYVVKGDHVELRRASADLTALDGMLDRSEREPASIKAMHRAVIRAAD